MMRGFQWMTMALTPLLLAACAAGNTRQYTYQIDPSVYIVQSGDTLESISWRYQIAMKNLVLWNNLQAGAQLRPGRRLMVRRPPQAIINAGRAANQRESSQPRRSSAGSAPAAVVSKPSSKARSAAIGAARPTARPITSVPRKPVTPPQAAAQPPQSAGVAQSAGNTAGDRPKTTRVAGVTWQWPVEGRLVSGFSAAQPDQQGINIAGQLGQPVRAAATGKVVYSGVGLVAYGKLVIVKHNSRLLSAYGHNQRLLVGEGDEVRAGQVIAYMGEDEDRRARLHFEIRKDGKPVNPSTYLPKP